MASTSSKSQSVKSNRWQPDDITHLIECCSKNITKLERINTWKNIATEMTLVRKKSFQATECKKEWHNLKRMYDTWKRFEDNRIKFENYFILMDKTLCETSKEVKPHSTLYRSVTVTSTNSSSSSSSKSSVVAPQQQTRQSKTAVSCNLKEVDEEGAAATIRSIKYEKLKEQISITDDVDLEAATEIKLDEQIAKTEAVDVEAARERRHKENLEKADEFLFLFRRLAFLMGRDTGDIVPSPSSPSLTTDL